jgi:hypothetical protein
MRPARLRSHGAMPLVEVEEAVLLPVSRSEAFWIGLESDEEAAALCLRIAACDTGRSKRDALTGNAWLETVSNAPQNYVVCPPQRAIDGVAAPHRPHPFARVTNLPQHYYACHELRISTMPLRQDLTSGSREVPSDDRPFLRQMAIEPIVHSGTAEIEDSAVLPDPYGKECWDTARIATVRLELVTFEKFQDVTGKAPPPLDPEGAYEGWRLP